MLQSGTDFRCPLPPERNLVAYKHLYALEVGLRELIIETLYELDGFRWYKTRLPSDVLAKYKEGRRKENSIPWTTFVHHDPIYYVDFPELSKIMDNGRNWRDAFQEIFGTKQVFIGHMKSLEEVRNKVAHNRRVTQTDLDMVQSVYALVENSLGQTKLEALNKRFTDFSDAESSIHNIRREAARCFDACHDYRALPPRSSWEGTKQSPWFGILAAEKEYSDIATFFDLLDEYDARHSSSHGYQIDRWIRDNALLDAHEKLESVLTQMLEEADNEQS